MGRLRTRSLRMTRRRSWTSATRPSSGSTPTSSPRWRSSTTSRRRWRVSATPSSPRCTQQLEELPMVCPREWEEWVECQEVWEVTEPLVLVPEPDQLSRRLTNRQNKSHQNKAFGGFQSIFVLKHLIRIVI